MVEPQLRPSVGPHLCFADSWSLACGAFPRGPVNDAVALPILSRRRVRQRGIPTFYNPSIGEALATPDRKNSLALADEARVNETPHPWELLNDCS